MSGKTDFDVTMIMAAKVPLSYVDSSTIQKQETKDRGGKVLGVTVPSVAIPEPTITWDEVQDKATKMVSLAVAKVSVEVSISAKVMIDKAIDKKSRCHKHVWDHEKRHLDAYKAGAKSQTAAIRRAVTDAAVPQRKKPLAVEEKDVRKIKEKTEKRIIEALDGAVIAAIKEIKADSLSIHTPDELKKTNGVCAIHLQKP